MFRNVDFIRYLTVEYCISGDMCMEQGLFMCIAWCEVFVVSMMSRKMRFCAWGVGFRKKESQSRADFQVEKARRKSE